MGRFASRDNLATRTRCSAPWIRQQGQITRLQQEHWMLHQALEETGLNRLGMALLMYVVHPTQVWHHAHLTSRFYVVLIVSVWGDWQVLVTCVSSDYSRLVLRQAEGRRFVLLLSMTHVLRQSLGWFSPLLLHRFDVYPHLAHQEGVVLALPLSSLLAYFPYTLRRLLVLVMPLSLLSLGVRSVFCEPWPNRDGQVTVLGLVYERAAAERSRGGERLALWCTRAMVDLYGEGRSWVNQLCPRGLPLLILAAPLPALVRTLLDHDADLDLPARDGTSFLQEVLTRLPGRLPIGTIHTLLHICMKRVGTLKPRDDKLTLGCLHVNVLENPVVMAMLLEAEVFTPSSSVIIPDSVSEEAAQHLKNLFGKPARLRTRCRQEVWKDLHKHGERRNAAVQGLGISPGLKSLLLCSDMQLPE